jgi:hypothetical protein
MTESALVRDILLRFGSGYGGQVWPIRINSMAARGVKRLVRSISVNGFPDFLFVLAAGRCAFVEAKSQTGKLREEQTRFRDKAIRMGHTYILARSVEDVERGLGLG